MAMQPHHVPVNGVELVYLDQGRGTPLILVHGSLGDYRTWRRQMGPLSEHYRVIAYSRRYHYPNTWVGDGTDYSAALHADDLARVIGNLRLGRSHVVASSFGAYTALVLAMRHPDLVRSLILGEPPLMPWLQRSVEGQRLAAVFLATAWEPARLAFQRGAFAEGIQVFVDGVNGPGTFDRLPPTGRQMLMDNARAMEAETRAAAHFTPVTCEDVQRITAPVLLLTGELSPQLFHTITDELERCVAHPARAVIEKASHGMHLGNPQAFTQTVLSFLAQQSGHDGA